jgi:hypothetical protein
MSVQFARSGDLNLKPRPERLPRSQADRGEALRLPPAGGV